MKVFEEYDYDLPDELVAKTPAHPRDAARLFVYDSASDTITFDIFAHLDRYLSAGDVVVLNDTKVLPARAFVQESGKPIEILFLLNEHHSEERIVKGIVGGKLTAGNIYHIADEVTVRAIGNEKNIFSFELLAPYEIFIAALKQKGTMPIPPYLGKSEMSESALRTEYQTIFAAHEGSVAAPTASLHFTDEVFARLHEKGIEKAYTTLHVGLGTFSPVTETMLVQKELHREPYWIGHDAIAAMQKARSAGRRIVACGTTVARTLESVGAELFNQSPQDNAGETALFIQPPFAFQAADALVTNFHVPRSSLMCLVDAFLEHKKASRKIIDLYNLAIQERFRFFSFGDAMLIL
jgi:S-adenosylmethionine:tRNA ribosyltransferase-isomerase